MWSMSSRVKFEKDMTFPLFKNFVIRKFTLFSFKKLLNLIRKHVDVLEKFFKDVRKLLCMWQHCKISFLARYLSKYSPYLKLSRMNF